MSRNFTGYIIILISNGKALIFRYGTFADGQQPINLHIFCRVSQMQKFTVSYFSREKSSDEIIFNAVALFEIKHFS